MFNCNSYGILPIERHSSRYHLEKRYTKRVDIRAWADDTASRLFRRKIMNRTKRSTGRKCDRMIRRSMRDTEVRHLCNTVTGDQDIVRFDISVHDTVLMRSIQGHTDLNNDRNSDLPVKMTILQDHVFNSNALDILLNHIADITFLPDTEYMNDIGMGKR